MGECKIMMMGSQGLIDEVKVDMNTWIMKFVASMKYWSIYLSEKGNERKSCTEKKNHLGRRRKCVMPGIPL